MEIKQVANQLVYVMPLFTRKMDAKFRAIAPHLDEVHFRVLGSLMLRPLPLGKLAESLRVTPATMSNTVATLVERGWVERHSKPEDRRVQEIRLTAEGKRIFDEVHREITDWMKAYLGELNQDDLNAVFAGLQILGVLMEKSELEELPEDVLVHRRMEPKE